MDLREMAPRSPSVELGGLVLLARTIDKARAARAGTLGAYKISPGMSVYLLEWLGIAEAEFVEAVEACPDDEAVVAWTRSKADPATFPSINARLRERAIRDPEHRKTVLPAYPLLDGRMDLSNWFEILDYDDALSFGRPVTFAPRRYVTYAAADGTRIGGIVAGSTVRPFPGDVARLEFFIALEPADRDDALARVGPPVALADVRLLAPLRPHKNVFCVGRNYVAHTEEAARARGVAVDLPGAPAFFTKAPTAIVGPDAELDLDPEVSLKYDWEAELAVVIGRDCRDVAAADALDVIFGYTCINDVTARDLQKLHQQWFKGKSLDASCPMGPWIVDVRDVRDPQQLDVEFTLDGERKQFASTAQMIFPVREIIASLTRGMTLEPADVIATGTPEGVGFARTPPEFLRDGQEMIVSVSGVGALRNRVRLRALAHTGA